MYKNREIPFFIQGRCHRVGGCWSENVNSAVCDRGLPSLSASPG